MKDMIFVARDKVFPLELGRPVFFFGFIPKLISGNIQMNPPQ